MYRSFIFGNDQTGLVVDGTDGVTVKGGEDLLLAVDAILGQAGIYVGATSTTGTFAYPAATVAAWEGFIATATATVLPPLRRRATTDAAKRSGAASVGGAAGGVVAIAVSMAALVVSLFLSI